VVGVQVGQQERVEVREAGVPLQRPESPVAEVEEDPPGAAGLVVRLDQVARGR
jgi:hypothetical protein